MIQSDQLFSQKREIVGTQEFTSLKSVSSKFYSQRMVDIEHDLIVQLFIVYILVQILQPDWSTRNTQLVYVFPKALTPDWSMFS
jgi:hypothetical protein